MDQERDNQMHEDGAQSPATLVLTVAYNGAPFAGFALSYSHTGAFLMKL